MKKRLVCFMVLASLAWCTGAFASPNWRKPSTWFHKKSRSTTVIGTVDAVADGTISFKTVDGQTLFLIGKKAANVAENRGVKVRVFGNVYKPDAKYPSGAIQVRNFKLLEEKPLIEANEVAEAKPAQNEVVYGEPQAYTEPEPYTEPEAVEEPTAEPPAVEAAPESPVEAPEANAVQTVTEVEDDEEPPFVSSAEEPAEEVKEAAKEPVIEQSYVVVSGDTLGKISKKIYGTTAQWKKIANYNNITNPKHLKVGMTLKIP